MDFPFKRCKFLIKYFSVLIFQGFLGSVDQKKLIDSRVLSVGQSSTTERIVNYFWLFCIVLYLLLVISVPLKWIKIFHSKYFLTIINCWQFVCHEIIELLFRLNWQSIIFRILYGLIQSRKVRRICRICKPGKWYS